MVLKCRLLVRSGLWFYPNFEEREKESNDCKAKVVDVTKQKLTVRGCCWVRCQYSKRLCHVFGTLRTYNILQVPASKTAGPAKLDSSIFLTKLADRGITGCT